MLSVLGRIGLFAFADAAEAIDRPNLYEAFLRHFYVVGGGIAFGTAAGSLFALVLALFQALNLETDGRTITGIASGVAGGIVVAIAVGMTTAITGGLEHPMAVMSVALIAFGLAVRIVVAITDWLTTATAIGLLAGFSRGIVATLLSGNTNVLGAAVFAIISGTIGMVVGMLVGLIGLGHGGQARGGLLLTIVVSFAVGSSVGIEKGIGAGMAFAVAFFRGYYLLVPLLSSLRLTRNVAQGGYSNHPVAWDDTFLIPFPGLQKVLIAYAEYAPRAAEAEIKRLIERCPSQRTAAFGARAIMIARRAGRETDLSRLRHIVDRLPRLKETSQLQEMILQISQQQSQLNAIHRAHVREPNAKLLCAHIQKFLDHVTVSKKSLASEFAVAARRWMKIAERQVQDAKDLICREPTPQVFQAGRPVDRAQDAFLPRDNVIAAFEHSIMLPGGCPGILLYGRRRMGKSSLLRNTRGVLDPNIRVAYIDMLDTEASASLMSFIGLVSRKIRETLPRGSQLVSTPRSMIEFQNFLGECNAVLKPNAERLAVAIDEYNRIDAKIGTGVFSEDFLALIRFSIQTHRQLAWIFAGSHHITELVHAAWRSHFVSVRTVEVPPFTRAESQLLLTEPVRYQPKHEDYSNRAYFDPAFWGEEGIDRIHAEAAGWPHFVQLIAEITIDLLNQRNQHKVTPALLEFALEKAVDIGDAVLSQLMRDECRTPAEWEYLARFRRETTQRPPDNEDVRQSLQVRRLVEEVGDVWRLRVPLMQRWLRRRT